MDQCCADKDCAIALLQGRQKSTLERVLAINATMFAVEFVAGLLAGSVALLADSLDMLGDALVYGLSLYAVARGVIWKARAAIVKATVMGLFAAFVLAELVVKLLSPTPPAPLAMGAIGAAALLANAWCFVLLYRHRAEDINMRSVWLCSRNDLCANVLVVLAAWLVWKLGSAWPDIAAGAVIGAVFVRSAVVVAREARSELRQYPRGPVHWM